MLTSGAILYTDTTTANEITINLFNENEGAFVNISFLNVGVVWVWCGCSVGVVWV